MRETELYVAGRGRGWRDVERALARAFRVQGESIDDESRAYFDTFDGRLYRSGLELMAVGDRVCLRDAGSAETVGEGRWTGADGLRFARALQPPELRERVAAITEPRAFEEFARARVAAHETAAFDASGQPVARVRFEAVTVRRGGRPRTLRVAFVTVPKAARRAESMTGVRGALRDAGFRAASRPWADILLAASGRNRTQYRALPRPAIDVSATLRGAALAIFPRLLATMTRNEAGIRAGIDPEFLHDYRVALRRTRTGLSELAGVFRAEDARRFRAGFATLSEPTGRVRDLEVQLGSRVEYARWIPDVFADGLEPVTADIARECRVARADLLRTLAGRDYAALKRDWKHALGELASGRPGGVEAEEPALPAARAAIARRYARLRQLAVATDALDDAALHRTRVQGKRLRYLLEFFARPLGDEAEDAIAGVERLQDALGAFHDTGVQLAELNRLAREARGGGADAIARAGAIGALMARLQVRRAKTRRRSARRLAELTGRKWERTFERLLQDDT